MKSATYIAQIGGSMLDEKPLKALSAKLVAEPDDFIHSFRRNISLYIDQKEITLQEVAELADISLSTLKSFLYGDSKDCNLSMAVKLARVFGVSIDELVGAGTITEQTCDSLQILRQLPESFTHYLRWEIQFHHDMLKTNRVSEKSIEVMRAAIGENGNMVLSNDMEVIDISHLKDGIKPKVFVGIRIPTNLYAPKYFEGDILLIANDREPLNGEQVVICYDSNIWILEKKTSRVNGYANEIGYYSIRDGGKRATKDDIQFIIGYIAGIERR